MVSLKTDNSRVLQVNILLVLTAFIEMQLVPYYGPPPHPIPVGVPVPGPPQPVPYPVGVPAPVPMPYPVPVMPEIKVFELEVTSTTTPAPRAIAVALQYPMPHPVQFAVPAVPLPAFCQSRPRHKGCPPCPPCVCAPTCTPAFFSYCSSCHQRCRCKDSRWAPRPLPPLPPVSMHGPVFAMPAAMAGTFMGPQPPYNMVNRHPETSCDDSTDDTSHSDQSCSISESSDFKQKRRPAKKLKRRPKKRKHIYRRSGNRRSLNDDKYVKPILTYYSRNGEVKFEKSLTHEQAKNLLNDEENRSRNIQELWQQHKTLQVGVSETNPKGVISSKKTQPHPSLRKKKTPKHVLLRDGGINILNEGKKELIFKPPPNKVIKNLTVRFEID